MTTCDNCTFKDQLERLNIVIRQLQVEVDLRKTDERTMKLKHPKGFVEGLERAIKLLEEAK